MNFYIPVPRLNERPHLLVLMIEEQLAAHGRRVTQRRIRALIWDDGEQEENILVGADFYDCESGDCPVLLILEDEADPDLIYVVTLSDAVTDTMPRSIRLDPLWRVVDFDDSPSGGGTGAPPRPVRV